MYVDAKKKYKKLYINHLLIKFKSTLQLRYYDFVSLHGYY